MKKIGCVQHDCDKCMAQRTALKLARDELVYVLTCINANRMPFDGDDFHEALRAIDEVLGVK